MESVKVSRGDFTRSASQEVRALRSKLSAESSAPLAEYQVRSPGRSENIGQILAWIEQQADINRTGAYSCDFSLLSDEFHALELTAK
jgi:hypothetical protein